VPYVNIISGTIYFFNKQIRSSFIKLGILSFVFLFIGAGVYKGVINNVSAVKSSAKDTLNYKRKFDVFFDKNSFDKNVNFVVVGVPFVSDIQKVQLDQLYPSHSGSVEDV